MVIAARWITGSVGAILVITLLLEASSKGEKHRCTYLSWTCIGGITATLVSSIAWATPLLTVCRLPFAAAAIMFGLIVSLQNLNEFLRNPDAPLGDFGIISLLWGLLGTIGWSQLWPAWAVWHF